MPLNREQKQKIVEDLKEKIERQKAMIFIDLTGLRVKDLSNLRKKLRAADNELKVAKKTLMGIAFKEAKLKIEAKELLGEAAVIFGFKDGLSPAKIIYQFAETNPSVKILGGYLENKFVETEQIIELAKLPAREELLARLVGSISAPVQNFRNVLQGNIKGFVFLLSQIKSES